MSDTTAVPLPAEGWKRDAEGRFVQGTQGGHAVGVKPRTYQVENYRSRVQLALADWSRKRSRWKRTRKGPGRDQPTLGNW